MNRAWQALAFLAGVLATGLPYWLLPYRVAEPPGALIGPGLAGFAAIALLLVLFGLATARRTLAIMAACLPAAIALRVVVEAWRDPTAHNLWPFELVIGGLLGVAVLLPAIGLGVMLRWVVLGPRTPR